MKPKTRGERRGRPKKGQEPGERVALSLRVTKRANLQLREAAARHGRSISQEAEYRLDRSFERQALCAEVLELKFGRGVAGLLLLLGETMQFTLETFGTLGFEGKVSPAGLSKPEDEDWLKDPYAYAEMQAAAAKVLALFQPEGKVQPPPEIAEAMRRLEWTNIPRFVTTPIVEALKGNFTGDNPLTRLVDEARPLLAGLEGPTARSKVR